MKTTTVSAAPDVRGLFDLPSPVLSVYLGRVQPAHEYEMTDRHEAVLRRAAHGVPRACFDTLKRLIDAAPAGMASTAVFIGADGTYEQFSMPGAQLDEDLIQCSALPHLTPLLAWWQARPARVVAVLDRAAADITTHPAGDGVPVTDTVDGPDDEIVRNAPGGWSQLRHQHRAEDSWQHNAGRYAEAVSEALDRSGARLLLLAGDVRAVQFFTDQLPAWVRNEVAIHKVSGSRSEDGSSQLRARQVEAETALAVQARTRAVLDEFADRSGSAGLSVEGVAATLRALARGQVRTLLVTDMAGDARVAWFGQAATDVAGHTGELARNGVEPRRGPVTDVAVRAAALTDADIWVLDPDTPGAPYQGIGALCRFS